MISRYREWSHAVKNPKFSKVVLRGALSSCAEHGSTAEFALPCGDATILHFLTQAVIQKAWAGYRV
jgi:hypothetical protein